MEACATGWERPEASATLFAGEMQEIFRRVQGWGAPTPLVPKPVASKYSSWVNSLWRGDGSKGGAERRRVLVQSGAALPPEVATGLPELSLAFSHACPPYKHPLPGVLGDLAWFPQVLPNEVCTSVHTPVRLLVFPKDRLLMEGGGTVSGEIRGTKCVSSAFCVRFYRNFCMFLC